MLEVIGSKNFLITYEGTDLGEYDQKINKYLLENRDGGSQEFIYVTEDQVNELINLLGKLKELL